MRPTTGAGTSRYWARDRQVVVLRPAQDVKEALLGGNLELAHCEPKSVKQALTNPNWLFAMQQEYEALMKNNNWSLVPLPQDRKPIGCKWVFRVKENADGSINKYKARLVAKGFNQVAGFDFSETFSLVIKLV